MKNALIAIVVAVVSSTSYGVEALQQMLTGVFDNNIRVRDGEEESRIHQVHTPTTVTGLSETAWVVRRTDGEGVVVDQFVALIGTPEEDPYVVYRYELDNSLWFLGRPVAEWPQLSATDLLLNSGCTLFWEQYDRGWKGQTNSSSSCEVGGEAVELRWKLTKYRLEERRKSVVSGEMSKLITRRAKMYDCWLSWTERDDEAPFLAVRTQAVHNQGGSLMLENQDGSAIEMILSRLKNDEDDWTLNLEVINPQENTLILSLASTDESAISIDAGWLRASCAR